MTNQTQTQTRLWSHICALLAAEGQDANKLSIDRLTATLGIGRGSVQRIKDGHENLRTDTMKTLAKRFKVESSYFLKDPDDLAHEGHAETIRKTLEEARAKESALLAQSTHDLSPQARRVAKALDSISDSAKRSQVALALLDIIDEMADAP